MNKLCIIRPVDNTLFYTQVHWGFPQQNHAHLWGFQKLAIPLDIGNLAIYPHL